MTRLQILKKRIDVVLRKRINALDGSDPLDRSNTDFVAELHELEKLIDKEKRRRGYLKAGQVSFCFECEKTFMLSRKRTYTDTTQGRETDKYKYFDFANCSQHKDLVPI